MRELNGMLTLSPANACPPVDHVVPPNAPPHVHTNLGTSQLANPNAETSGLLAARSRGLLPPVFHFTALLWQPFLQRSKSRNLANSRSSRPIPWVFSCEAPMHDPEPTVQICSSADPTADVVYLFNNICVVLGVTRLTAITHRPSLCFAKIDPGRCRRHFSHSLDLLLGKTRIFLCCDLDHFVQLADPNALEPNHDNIYR
jgi:hypothetical protein